MNEAQAEDVKGNGLNMAREDLGEWRGKANRREWESRNLKIDEAYSIRSRCGHEESALKSGGPPSKPKYYLMTDSE